jgi:hypothetical protein
MENQLVCLDTSVLIDFYRKANKEKGFGLLPLTGFRNPVRVQKPPKRSLKKW